MKFLDTSSLKFEFFVDLPTSEYAIFSHGPSTQLENPAESIDERVLRACDEAKARNIRYLWSHDLCTRQNSLEDAIEFANSSFRLAWNARVYLIYLHDLLPKDADSHKRTVQGDLSKCVWFTQMWNIQHLVAAQDVEFFDHHWNLRGTKASGYWPGFLSHASGIDESVLANRNSLFDIPIGRRLPWSSQRQTSRPEDVAYAMMGICEIALTPRYGEGGRAAFQRLEEKLFKKTGDSSILTWRKQSDSRAVSMRHAPVRPEINPPKRHSKRSMDVMLQQDQPLEKCSQRCSQGDDVLLLDTLPDKPRRLADHHPYHSLVSELATIGLKAWEEEKGSAAGLGRSENSASVHSQFTLSFRPRKRARRGRQLEDHSTSHSDGSCTVETDSSDSDTMVVVQHRTHANASHLLACPFYRLEPARFHSCMWQLEIHDMRTLKQHLIVDHHLPDYCPVCYETFDSAASRDTHIVARSCSSREAPAGMMRGVSEDQVEKLSRSYVERGRMARDVSRRRSRPRQRRTITSEEQEWRSVWDILFPTAPQPHSIYLSERHERKVVSLREFWHKVGPAMIANILEERGMRRWEDANEESDLEALFGSVLASMMENLS